MWPLLGASILAGLGIAFGLVFLIVPGLILLTWWALIPPSIVLENRGVFESFGRSRELVRGHAWNVFGVLIITYLLSAVISGVIRAIFTPLPDYVGTYIGDVIGGSIVAPLLGPRHHADVLQAVGKRDACDASGRARRELESTSVAGSSNGRTLGSGPSSLGSNPSPAASLLTRAGGFDSNDFRTRERRARRRDCTRRDELGRARKRNAGLEAAPRRVGDSGHVVRGTPRQDLPLGDLGRTIPAHVDGPLALLLHDGDVGRTVRLGGPGKAVRPVALHLRQEARIEDELAARGEL